MFDLTNVDTSQKNMFLFTKTHVLFDQSPDQAHAYIAVITGLQGHLSSRLVTSCSAQLKPSLHN